MAKVVTARFKISRVTPYGEADEATSGEVEMTPDYAQGKNAEWAQATPSGTYRMHVNNPDAYKVFAEAVGKPVHITLEVDPDE